MKAAMKARFDKGEQVEQKWLHDNGRRKRERNETFFRPDDRHVVITTVVFWRLTRG